MKQHANVRVKKTKRVVQIQLFLFLIAIRVPASAKGRMTLALIPLSRHLIQLIVVVSATI
jgi:hypothetical protein